MRPTPTQGFLDPGLAENRPCGGYVCRLALVRSTAQRQFGLREIEAVNYTLFDQGERLQGFGD